MRASKLFFPTLREEPRDAEMASHRMLLRGGFIRSVAAGVYSYLPLGWRVHEKIARIVREEIDGIGGQEIHMPVLIPKELLDESGRSSVPVLFALKDRNQREFFLGFTHEEVVTDIVRTSVRSWKQMPLYLYQIQTKERDEPRPRGGLVRGREFTMFDGYSFDTSAEALDTVYRANYEAYSRIFRRCGLDFLAVEADPGAIGGSENHEFMVLTPEGEDTVLRCPECSYAANVERAEVRPPAATGMPQDGLAQSKVVSTPGAHTVAEVAAFLAVPETEIVKTIICVAAGQPFAALVRGDRDLNLPKLSRMVGDGPAELADPATVLRVTGAPVGFAGPVSLAADLRIYVDFEVATGEPRVVGANQPDAHITGVVCGRDYAATAIGDIRSAVEGDACPRCAAGVLREARGIEVAHIFKLGTKYSSAMGATYQPETGPLLPILMGCYGLGVSRTMASAVEAHHDDAGIVWPLSIAPFHAVIIIASMKDELQVRIATEIYEKLHQHGVETLLDDRDERIGVKFKDQELIGVPIQIVVGKGTVEGMVEIGVRADGGTRQGIPVTDAVRHVAEQMSVLRAQTQP